MTKSEIAVIHRALDLLHQLVPSEEPYPGGPAPWRSPVHQFIKEYLVREPGGDMSCAELWRFYTEIVAAGELEPLTKQEFLRKLPGALEATFGVKKCHNVERDGAKVRGFKSVTIREETSPTTPLEPEPH
jgi:hypothetical protein